MPNLARCVVALFCSAFLELGGLESAYVEYTLFGEEESNGMHMSVLANTYVCAGAVAVLQMHELLPSPPPSPALTHALTLALTLTLPHPVPPRPPAHLANTLSFTLVLVLTRCF